VERVIHQLDEVVIGLTLIFSFCTVIFLLFFLVFRILLCGLLCFGILALPFALLLHRGRLLLSLALYCCYFLHELGRLLVQASLAQIVKDLNSGFDRNLMELLVLDLDLWLIWLRELIVIEVINCFSVDVAIVDVLLLLGFVFFSLLMSDQVLTLDVEGVVSSQVDFEKLDQLKLVGLPSR